MKTLSGCIVCSLAPPLALAYCHELLHVYIMQTKAGPEYIFTSLTLMYVSLYASQ